MNEEVLLFTALACGVFLGLWAVQRRVWPPLVFFKALGVAGLVALVLLAYPLWVQFFGPQHYRGLGSSGLHIRSDAVSYFAFATVSLSGLAAANADLAPNFAEENTFLGWPLIVLTGLIVVWLRRDLLVRTLALTAAGFAVLSLGSPILVGGVSTGIKAPWGLLNNLPILDAVMPSRFGLVVAACVGVLLALGTDAFLRACRGAAGGATARMLGAGALAVALVPLVPTPLSMTSLDPVPQFISGNGWRDYVSAGQTLVPVPVPSPYDADGLRWAAAVGVGFAVPRGYFLGPEKGIAGEPGMFGAPASRPVDLLNRVRSAKDEPLTDPDPGQRAELLELLREWNASAVVLDARGKSSELHRENLAVLFGPGRQVDDAWLWDVRPIVQRKQQ